MDNEPIAQGPVSANMNVMAEVSKLLGQTDESPEPEVKETPEGEPAQETADESPLTVEALAERLGTEPARLYDLEIAISEGESATKVKLSELKDAYKASTELKRLEDKLSKSRSEFESRRIAELRELEAFVSVIPKEALKPELIEAAQRKAQYFIEAERAAMFRVIPEWENTETLRADRARMVEHLKPFGFREHDVDAIMDHRLMAYIRHHALAESKAKAEEKPPERKAQAPTKARQRIDAQRLRDLKRQVTTKRIRPEEAVAEILKGI